MWADWMNQLVDHLPVGYAFGAGMVSSVNPCGFAMLPAYLSLYLGADEQEFYQESRLRRVGKAIWVTLSVSAGFILLFGVIGGIISAGGTLLISSMPWIGLIIGVMLTILGIRAFLGHSLSIKWLSGIAARIGDPRNVNLRGFFLFGVAFGAASLSCTLPIFLLVVGGAVSAGDFASGMFQFLSYAMGMGVVLLFLTLGIALFKEGLILRNIRQVNSYVQPVSALLLVGAGSYIVYYWLTNGQLFSLTH